MSGSLQQQILRDDLARLHDHVAKADDKLDTQSIQIAVLDSHVTKMTKEQSETHLKLETVQGKVEAVDRKVEKLTNKMLGGMAVVFALAEIIRLFFH